MQVVVNERINLYEKAKMLRAKGWNTKQIADEVNVPLTTVNYWTYMGTNPRRLHNMNHPNLSASPQLSYLIGVAKGDLCLNKNGGHYRIILAVKDLDFAQEFNRCVCQVLGKTKPYKLRTREDGRYCVEPCSKTLYAFLSQNLEKLSTIIGVYPASFIRGFADSDGTAYLKRDRKYVYSQVLLHNTNHKLLEYIQELLDTHFSIHSAIYLSTKKGTTSIIRGKEVTSRKNCYSLWIQRKNNAKKYSEQIGFSIKRKQRKLLFGGETNAN